MSELHDLTALEQSAAIRRGDVSCVELTRHYLDRTERLDETVGAFITVTADAALAQAAELDEQLARTEDTAELSPLFGVVAPVKDLDLVAGVRTTFGSRAYEDFVAPVDSEFVLLMRAAGLVITGKTNTPEFGFPCYTENDIAPPARTPWDLSRTAGGSSGGAATAVASGLASVAPGSDGGGSIRIPASATGLVGIKSSRGRVTQSPIPPALGELAAYGPLARTVADAAALLDVMTGTAVGDMLPPAPDAGEPFLSAAAEPVGRLRIARFAQPMVAETEVDPEVLAAWESTSELLVRLGHEVVDIERPFGPEVVPQFEHVWMVGAANIPLPPGGEERILPLTKHLMERGRAVSGQEVAAAVAAMRNLSRAAIAALHDFDAVLTPTLAQLPVPIGALRDDADPAGDFEAQKRFTPFTAPFNVSGQPAVSLPVAMSEAGLPIGMQFVGRPFDERGLIRLAAQLEAELRWQDRRPPVW